MIPLLTARSTSRSTWGEVFEAREKTITITRLLPIASRVAPPQLCPGRMSRGAIQHRTPARSNARQSASATVVVVEPARILTDEPQGLRALYVALTRATRRLTVVHEAPLPEVLGVS